MTPAEAAARIGVDPKRVRTWLRANRPSPTTGRWEVDAETFDELARGLAVTRPAIQSRTTRTGTRAESDEHYVLDLCDSVLGERGLRQHRFGWLLGDPGRSGRRERLRVDAYYPSAGVVVEYRERQHDEPVAHFDKPDRMTVSGVHRGEQRRLYDQRRDKLIPAHGLQLWVIRPSQVGGDPRGRLTRRDPDRDQRAVAELWAELRSRTP